jgi:large subunit ribosomal protein L24
MAAKIRQGDQVIVTAGRDKGHIGTVLRINKTDWRVVVEGAAMVSKHMKPNPQAQTEGGIVKREAAIHLSNIMVYNPMTKKGDRVRFKFLKSKDGTQKDRKVRCYVSNGEMID